MLKRALLATYAAQAYVGLLGLLLMPLYLRLMGPEAFALIGIFWTLQTVVQVLDLGLTPAVSRELSRFRAGVVGAADAWRAVHAIECMLGLMAGLVVVGFFVSRHWLAQHWLDATSLSPSQVGWSLVAMVVAATLRWIAGLYRGGMIGLERQVWVSWAAVAFVTLRFVGVIPVIVFVSSAPLTFFAYQMLVSLLEMLVLRWKLADAFGQDRRGAPYRLGAILAVLPMAGSMAFMSALWIVQSQSDKLILSKLLPLAEYGHFTLAVMVASAVLVLAPPITQVLQPRLTVLSAQSRLGELSTLYSVATQCITALFGALGFTLALFAEPVVFAWTGDHAAAQAAAPVLVWYGLANAVTSLLMVPFALQFARGDLRLQLIGSLGAAAILLPALYFVARHRGGVGAGQVLFAVNLAYLLVWVPLIHRRLIPGRQWWWFYQDVVGVAAATLSMVYLASLLEPAATGRWWRGAYAASTFTLAALAGLLVGGRSRASALALLNRIMKAVRTHS